MIRSTLIARAWDGLPLAASSDDDDMERELPERKSQAKMLIRKMDSSAEPQGSVDAGSMGIHYIISESIIYLVITDKSYPRKMSFSYLVELSREFVHNFPPSFTMRPGLRPYACVKFDTFMQKTKRLYMDPRGAEVAGRSDLDQLSEHLQDVTRIMTKNMEDLLWRGDSLNRMSNMSSSLRDESLKYRKAARKINVDALIRKWAPAGFLIFLVTVVVWWKFG